VTGRIRYAITAETDVPKIMSGVLIRRFSDLLKGEAEYSRERNIWGGWGGLRESEWIPSARYLADHLADRRMGPKDGREDRRSTKILKREEIQVGKFAIGMF